MPRHAASARAARGSGRVCEFGQPNTDVASEDWQDEGGATCKGTVSGAAAWLHPTAERQVGALWGRGCDRLRGCVSLALRCMRRGVSAGAGTQAGRAWLQGVAAARPPPPRKPRWSTSSRGSAARAPSPLPGAATCMSLSLAHLTHTHSVGGSRSRSGARGELRPPGRVHMRRLWSKRRVGLRGTLSSPPLVLTHPLSHARSLAGVARPRCRCQPRERDAAHLLVRRAGECGARGLHQLHRQL